MNTILISGTAKPDGNAVHYNVYVWASKKGDPIQLIKWFSGTLADYRVLWALAKSNVMSYFGNDDKFGDGAYTQFLDHLILIN